MSGGRVSLFSRGLTGGGRRGRDQNPQKPTTCSGRRVVPGGATSNGRLRANGGWCQVAARPFFCANGGGGAGRCGRNKKNRKNLRHAAGGGWCRAAGEVFFSRELAGGKRVTAGAMGSATSNGRRWAGRRGRNQNPQKPTTCGGRRVMPGGWGSIFLHERR